MRALVYHSPRQRSWEDVPYPEITDDGDAIIGVDASTISASTCISSTATCRFLTHRFGLDGFEQACDLVTRAAGTGALKVMLTR